jgi:purine-nucleoside phosphorylase
VNDLVKRLDEAVVHIGSKTKLRPSVALVLGSGLGAFADSLGGATRIPYKEIPHFPVSTAIGHKGELVVGTSNGTPVAVLSGRVHRYEGYTQEQVVFPIRVLGRFGARIAILTNAAGSVNVNYHPGELMIIEDHINLTGDNPLIGENPQALGERFFDMSDAYDPRLREVAEKACRKFGVTVRSGVYIGLLGPSYETPAEIKMARTLGADAVGMSTVSEVIAARHMKLRVLGLSCITNTAAGVSKKPVDHRDVLEVAERVKQALLDVLGSLVEQTAKLA